MTLQYILLLLFAVLAGGAFGWYIGQRWIWPWARALFTLALIWWLCRNPERAIRRLDRATNLLTQEMRALQGRRPEGE